MTRLILASNSKTRARLLRAAGIDFETVPAYVDEDSVKSSLLAEKQSPRVIADALAELKALRVSIRHPDAFVLGADQILDFEGTLINKSETIVEARTLLLRLRGRKHDLVSASVLACNGAPIWRFVCRASLKMRAFSEDFLDDYLTREGDVLLDGVGCYRLEGVGAQLFENIEGDFFGILGLPLIPLLSVLRQHAVIGS